jgi:hypothetical protein
VRFPSLIGLIYVLVLNPFRHLTVVESQCDHRLKPVACWGHWKCLFRLKPATSRPTQVGIMATRSPWKP